MFTDRDSRPASELPRDGRARSGIGASLAPIGLLVTGYLAAFWPTLVGLVEDWANDPDLRYAFLVPPVCAVALWSTRDRWNGVPLKGSVLGFSVTLLAIVFFALGRLSFSSILERLGAWGAIIGAVWFLLGWGFLRQQPFPFLFLLLAIPPPFALFSPVRLGLVRLTTEMSAGCLSLIGIPVVLQGKVLAVGDARLEFSHVHSGILSIMAMVTVAVLLSYLFRTGFWKGLLFLGTALPLIVLVQVLGIVVVVAALVEFDFDLAKGGGYQLVRLSQFAFIVGLLVAAAAFYGRLSQGARRRES